MKKQMSRLVPVLIILTLALTALTGCDDLNLPIAVPANPNDVLLKNSVELAGIIVELAGSSSYIETVAPPNDEYKALLVPISRFDFAKPQRALLLTVPESEL